MATELKSILRLEVPLIVHIADRTMTVAEVSKLAPGAIIELPKLADEELDILISNRRIGKGAAVKVGENFGIRVTYIGDQKQRIRAMGGEPGYVGPTDDDSNADAVAEEILTGQ